MTHLTLEHYTKTFSIDHLDRRVPAFHDLNVTLQAGTFTLVQGPNGVGKSTLLRCLYRTYKPSSGRALYRSRYGDIDLATAADVDIVKLRREELGMVTQFLRARPRVSAVELVAEPLLASLTFDEATERAAAALRAFGLKEALWHAYPSTFSGGEQQKVNLARALIAPRRLLLLDEPTASLDQQARAALTARLAELKAQGVTMIGVFHHPEDVAALVDEGLELAAGGAEVEREARENLIGRWGDGEIGRKSEGHSPHLPLSSFPHPSIPTSSPLSRTQPRPPSYLTNARLVLPESVTPGTLTWEDGVITEISERRTSPAASGVDAHGCLVLPGLIDLHGDMIERDVEPRPKAYFPTDLALFELDKRLAALGVTTAYAAISFAESFNTAYLRSEERARDTIHLINSLKADLLVDTRIHARFEVTNHGAPRILHDLLRDEHLDLISLNDHTPGQGQYRDLEAHVKHVAAWKGVSEEAHREKLLARLAQLEANPPSWDVITGVCEAARAAGVVLASHDDDTPDKIDVMASLGASVSEFPVTLEAAREAKRRGLYTVMGAPNAFRGGSNTGNLSALDALREGLVDVLASDYYPAAMLHIVFNLKGTLPLHEAVKLVSQNAAAAAGLTDRGRLAVGQRADFVVVEAREGHLPRVRATFSGGRCVYSDGTLALSAVAPTVEGVGV